MNCPRSFIRGASVLAVLALFVAFGCGDDDTLNPSKATVSDSFVRTAVGMDLSGLEAKTTNGRITVGEKPVSEVVVRIRLEVSAPTVEEASDFADLVEVSVERVGSEVLIDSSYPTTPSGVNVTVDYDIDSPPATGLLLRTVNGRILTSKTTGSIDARVTNGGVDARIESMSRFVSLTAVNGSINMVARGGDATVSAELVNGSIDVTLPSELSGILSARTANGVVDCGFPVTGENTPNRVLGKFGDGPGTTPVTLETANGGVFVRKQGSAKQVSNNEQEYGQPG